MLAKLPVDVAEIADAEQWLRRSNGAGAHRVADKIAEWLDGGCVGDLVLYEFERGKRDAWRRANQAERDHHWRNAAALCESAAELHRTGKTYSRSRDCNADECPHAPDTLQAHLWAALKCSPLVPCKRELQRRRSEALQIIPSGQD